MERNEQTVTAPNIGHLIVTLRELGQDMARNVHRAEVRFRELWRTKIDIAYSAARRDLLRVLVANRQVQAVMPRTPYCKRAERNIARILARLGCPKQFSAEAVSEQSERSFLEWLAEYRTGEQRGPAKQPRRKPPVLEGDWQAVSRVLSFVTGNELEESDLQQTIADVQRYSSVPCRELVVRIALKQMAYRALARERCLEAFDYAGRIGEDGRSLCELIRHEGGLEPGATVSECEYHAYLARRQRDMCRTLGYEAEAKRWAHETDRWNMLAGYRACEDA